MHGKTIEIEEDVHTKRVVKIRLKKIQLKGLDGTATSKISRGVVLKATLVDRNGFTHAKAQSTRVGRKFNVRPRAAQLTLS